MQYKCCAPQRVRFADESVLFRVYADLNCHLSLRQNSESVELHLRNSLLIQQAQRPEGKKRLAGSSTSFDEGDRRRPPLLNRASVGGGVAKAVQNDKLLGFRRSLVDALSHPDWIRMISITVQHQQRRMAMRDGRNIVPPIRKRMRHPSRNAPSVNSALAGG